MVVNILLEIKSKYVMQNIFSLIQENIEYKLVKYSKAHQQELDLKLIDYKNAHFYYKNITKISWSIYLCFHNYIERPGKEEDIHEDYDDKFLKTKLEKDLSNHNLEFNDYRVRKKIIEHFKNYIKENNFIEIDLYSPLFDILSSAKIFESRFIIQIPLYRFKYFDLSKLDLVKTDFNNKLKLLNKSIYYSFACISIEDLDLLKHLKINSNSVSILKLYLLNVRDFGTDYSLKERFHEKFPNLNNISIIIKNRYFYHSNNLYISDFNLEENNNSTIKNIKIDMNDSINRIELYCNSFKTLESIDLYFDDIPFTKVFNKSIIVFQSLYKFHFSYNYLPSNNDLIAAYNIIDKMPNLVDLKLEFGKYINIKEKYTKKLITLKDSYEILIKKVLIRKTIKIINISLTALFEFPEFYTQNELKEKFPNVNFYKFHEINIEKLSENNKLCVII